MTEYKEYRQCGTFGYSIVINGVKAGVIEYKDFWDGMPYFKPYKN